MTAAAAPGPSDILGRLLTSHPEAASLLAEASHRRALAAAAAMLMARIEPSAVFSRRRTWKRAHAEYQAAVRLEQADTEAATVAADAWLGLVRSQAAAVAGHEGVLRDVVAFAVMLQEAGQPRLTPVPPGGGPAGQMPGGQSGPAGRSGQE